MKHFIFCLLTFLLLPSVMVSQSLTVSSNTTVTISENSEYVFLVIENNGTLIVNNGVTLKVLASASTAGTSTLIINGKLQIAGSFSVGNEGSLTITGSGVFIIGGSFSVGNNSYVNVEQNGEGVISGSMSIGNNSTLIVNGKLTIGGTYVGPPPSGNGEMTDGGGIVPFDPLPVVLLSTNIRVFNNTVEIHWSTASEHNNERFEILRSTDLKEWHNIGTVAGNGNSIIVNSYSFTDDNLIFGQLYYRIIQIDYNGKSEIIAQHTVRNSTNKNIYIYPNPVIEGNDWSIVGIGENDKIMIFNENLQLVDKTKLTKGLYYIVVNQYYSTKLLVQ